MSKRGPISTALALLFGVVLAAGCRPNQTVERQTKDAALKAQVKAKLATDVGAATVTAVEVNVTNGVVTLAGPVHNEEEKARAEAAARSVEGVTGVNNNLQVSAVEVAPPPGMTPPPTSAITPAAAGSERAMTPIMAMPPPTGTVVPMAATPPPATTP
jgi:translation elongation factor EF-1beta